MATFIGLSVLGLSLGVLAKIAMEVFDGLDQTRCELDGLRERVDELTERVADLEEQPNESELSL